MADAAAHYCCFARWHICAGCRGSCNCLDQSTGFNPWTSWIDSLILSCGIGMRRCSQPESDTESRPWHALCSAATSPTGWATRSASPSSWATVWSPSSPAFWRTGSLRCAGLTLLHLLSLTLNLQPPASAVARAATMHPTQLWMQPGVGAVRILPTCNVSVVQHLSSDNMFVACCRSLRGALSALSTRPRRCC